MKTEELKPYYQCFVQWLGIVHPLDHMRFVAGQVGVDEAKILIREWARDITNK